MKKSNFTWAALGIFIMAAPAALLFLNGLLRHASTLDFWHYLALTGVFCGLSVLSLSYFLRNDPSLNSSYLSGQAARRRKPISRPVILIIALQLALLSISLLVEGMGMFTAILCLTLTILIGFNPFEKDLIDNSVTISIAGSLLIVLISRFQIIARIEIPFAHVIMPALTSIILMILVILLVIGQIVATLRVKLISASLLIALVPLAMLSFAQSTVTRSSLEQQNFDGLNLAARQTASRVDEFILSNLSSVQKNAALPIFRQYVETALADRGDNNLQNGLNTTIQVIKNDPQEQYILSIGILNIKGENIYDTNSAALGNFDFSSEYFSTTVATRSPYISNILFDSTARPTIIFSAPIFAEDRSLIGVYRITYSAMVFQELMEANEGLFGSLSYPILLDENLIRIGDALDSGILYQPVTSLQLAKRNDLIGKYRLPLDFIENKDALIPEMANAISNYQKSTFFSYKTADSIIPTAGTLVKTSRLPWYVVYVQRQDFLYQLFQQQSQVWLLIATLIAFLISAAAIAIARLLSRPIVNLTEIAGKVTAGDLNAIAKVESKDEIGTLAQAFNQMTHQISNLINELEDRVQARTQELYHQNLSLQYRSQQLQTVSEVARSVTSTQDLQVLLNRVSALISQRFNFYHVGIFLVDERREYAVLRAANSEGGIRMLNRQHRLKIGEVGIVGYVAAKGEARIATDVGKDAVFFNNPDLPLTRSEMALPLKVGENIIGALDVQSTTANAFSDEDIELFSILSDQLTIAIINNRLFEETNKALTEIQGLHRQYLRQEWEREMEDREHPAFVYTAQGVFPQDISASPEVEKVFESGTPYLVPASADGKVGAAMAIPITLRGEPIGVIHLKEGGSPGRSWSADEVTTVQSVADQIALALENVRLLEQTSRRAERERRVLEITSKIRSTNDLQTMITVAVEELQRVLNASTAQVIFQEGIQIEDPKSGNGHHP